MATTATAVEQLEEGDIFFLVRPRLAAREVRGWADVQRFYMVLAARRPLPIYRLFVIGRKKLPLLLAGRQHRERRNWAVVVLVSELAEDVRRELAAYESETATRGRRSTPAAQPLGEGRYQLVRHRDHTELIYALERPRQAGPAQRAFEIRDQASYITAVKNPEIATPGTPSTKYPPAYPDRLRRKFASRRWIDAEPELLDYENAQLLLLAAHGEDAEDELGVQIDKATPLVEGQFPDHKPMR
jgi:hypothetical protein